MRIYKLLIVSAAAFTVACGGRSSQSVSSSQVSGAYEFVVTSNVTGGTTLVEANLSTSGNQVTASGPSQVQILTLENKHWYVNGVCFGSTPGQNSVSATLSGSNVSLAFNEGGNSIPGQGILAGSTITGDYSVSGSHCPDLPGAVDIAPGTDFGGFTGNQVPALVGTFSGLLSLPSGTENATFTLSEAGSQALLVNAGLNGPVDTGSFTLSGSAVGNVMFVSGSVGGTKVSWFGYFDRSGQFTGFPNSLLVFDDVTLNELGLLLGS